MSSSEEEFFDAPEALGMSARVHSVWDDDEDDLTKTFNSMERSCNNLERRNRVESLKKSILHHNNHPIDPNTRDENNLRRQNEVFSHSSIPTSSLPPINSNISSNYYRSTTFEAWLANTHHPIEMEDNHPLPPPPLVTTAPHSHTLHHHHHETNSPEDVIQIKSINDSPTITASPESINNVKFSSPILQENLVSDNRGGGGVQTADILSNTSPILSTNKQRPAGLLRNFHEETILPETTTTTTIKSPQTTESTIITPTTADATTQELSRHGSINHRPIPTTTASGATMTGTSASSTLPCNSHTSTSDQVVTLTQNPNWKKMTDSLSGNNGGTLDPVELQCRERTMSLEKRQATNRTSSLTYSEESDVGREISSQPGLLGSLLKRFQRSMHSALPKSKGDESDEDIQLSHGVRVRSARNMRNRRDFLQLRLVQEMRQEHTGAIWAMRFSPCGRLLATAGHDLHIRLWTLKQYYRFFKVMQSAEKSNTSASDVASASINHQQHRLSFDEEFLLDSISMASTSASTMHTEECSTCSSADEEEDLEHSRGGPFRSRPLLIWRGHEATVTELVWSRNLFLLSTSMDKQVRLWHVSRRENLCIFSHRDTVPGICFHPKDDRFFLSGSMDGMLRLWYIPDKRVHCSVEVPPVPSLLTAAAANFSSSLASTGVSGSASSTLINANVTSDNSNPLIGGLTEQKTIITCVAFFQDGAKIVVGTYDGRVMFFTTDLTYITSISFKPYHGKIRHCKVNGIEPDPTDPNKILVTTSDSRARLIDSRDYHTAIKYRGMVIRHSRIRASFSSTGRYIISGSENNQIYIWKKEHEVTSRLSRLSTTRKDRNGFWEAIRSHEYVVTCAQFSPNPCLILDRHLRKKAASLSDAKRKDYQGEVIVSADCSGVIKVYKNRLHKR